MKFLSGPSESVLETHDRQKRHSAEDGDLIE
jgi:hypothetical protein